MQCSRQEIDEVVGGGSSRQSVKQGQDGTRRKGSEQQAGEKGGRKIVRVR